ncbi:MAG: NAD-dependent protein deacylase [Christensenellales bacterium]|jgi:NAD-dependent deacetylase
MRAEQASLSIFETWVRESKRMVFLGGAGVSTESGVPDFRSADGLYQREYKYPPEVMLSRSFFMRHPREFYEFYRDAILLDGIRPNAAHETLARWEAQGKLSAIVTQNIDGLHQLAGSKNVLELHGSILRNSCMECGRSYALAHVKHAEGVPVCACGGIVKPDVVLYEEQLDDDVLERAISAIMDADLLIVGGTSLSVYPAAGLIDAYRGVRLVRINLAPTPKDERANLLFRTPIAELLGGMDA